VRDKHLRYTLPITAMQTFAQFHHLNQHSQGCLATFYPDPKKLKRILECGELCHHFFGGYAAKSVPNESSPDRKAHDWVTKGLRSGLHVVGPPGSGKTSLLSTPILLAALHGLPVSIVLGDESTFGVLSINFEAKSATMRYKQLGDVYTTNTYQYTTDLLAMLQVSIPPGEPHLLIVDPLEQKQSSVLKDFNTFYKDLYRKRPNLLIFSAHSTPFYEPPNQGKEGGRSIPSQYPYLQFTNMMLSHDSLKKLFTKVLLHHHLSQPYTKDQKNQIDQDIKSVVDVVSALSPPTIRCYQFVLTDTKANITSTLGQPAQRIDAGRKVFTRHHTLNKDTLGDKLGNVPWLIHAAYSSLDTDTGRTKAITSEILPYFFQDYREVTESITGLDEETNFWHLATKEGAQFWSSAHKTMMQITKRFNHTEATSSIMSPGRYQNITIHASPKKTLVYAKYLHELHNLGQKITSCEKLAPRQLAGYFVRLSPCFPLFDFALIWTNSGQAQIEFVSLKTGCSPLGFAPLYQQGAQTLCKYFNNGLDATLLSPATFQWRVLSQNSRLVQSFNQNSPLSQKNAFHYEHPWEDVFGFEDFKEELASVVKASPLFDNMFPKL